MRIARRLARIIECRHLFPRRFALSAAGIRL
jgi:hypothetical protein